MLFCGNLPSPWLSGAGNKKRIAMRLMAKFD